MGTKSIPNRRRWVILGIIFCAIVLNYFDRQIVSILKPTLKTQFGMSDAGYALLANVFTICYALMYPLAGLLVDRFGPRRMMLAGVLCWSAACIGAGISRAFAAFAFFRGMLGLAEPIAFPAQLRVVAAHFPGRLRATANSVSVAGGSAGAILAPPLVAWLALSFNWHSAFLVPGALGLVVTVAWWLLYREPEDHGAEPDTRPQNFDPTQVEAPTGTTLLTSSPASDTVGFGWAELWRTRSLWAILLCRFITDPAWYFCLFWLPGYLQEQSGLTLRQIGFVGWIPFLAADLGGIATAVWSDRMVSRGQEPLRARKLMLCTVAALAPVCALTPHFSHPAMTLLIFSVVGAIALSWLFSLSVVIAESFPAANVGSVLGITGGFGAAGALCFNYFVGQVMGTVGATKIFAIMALLHPAAAVLLWTLVRREQPLKAVGQARVDAVVSG